ncbi:transposase [Deinococcus fonticola]|uniref:transposase n=1 Tax=Deinococcus fonticola TaxID=2528713 RepID=UPI001431005F|nr:transposase [Deinococcus fonticola]
MFLPAAWTKAPDRCERVGVPKERQDHRTKLNIALEEIDRLLDLGVRFKAVLADAGYGNGASFRQG